MSTERILKLKSVCLMVLCVALLSGCSENPVEPKPVMATLKVANLTAVRLDVYADGGLLGGVGGGASTSYEIAAGTHTVEIGWGTERFLRNTISFTPGTTREVMVNDLPPRNLHYRAFCTSVNKNVSPWQPVDPGTSFPSGTCVICLMHWKFIRANDVVKTEWRAPNEWTDIDEIHLPGARDLVAMHTSVTAVTKGQWTVTYWVNGNVVATDRFRIR